VLTPIVLCVQSLLTMLDTVSGFVDRVVEGEEQPDSTVGMDTHH
jgi:hypothetical protein